MDRNAATLALLLRDREPAMQLAEAVHRQCQQVLTTLGALSKAQFVLGDEQAASITAAKALQKDPQQPTAKEVQTKVEGLKQIELLTAKVKSNPTDQAAKEQLNQTVNTVSRQPLVSPTVMLKVANAQTALGNHEQAEKNLILVRKINPQLLNQAHP